MPDEFIDAAGPQFVDAAGPEFVDKPAPSHTWQDRVTPYKLSNGKETVKREDGYVWQDASKGFHREPGWYAWKGNRWEMGPSEPGGKMTMKQRMVEDWYATKDNPIKHSLQRAMTTAGNTSMPGSIGGIVRDIRGIFSPKPMAGEQFIADPTAAGVIHGVANNVVAPAQLVGNVIGQGERANRAVDAYEGFFRDNFAPSESGKAIGAALPFVLSGGGSALAQSPGIIRGTSGIAKNAAIGGAASAGLTPEENVKNASDFWSRKLDEFEKGAAFSGGLSILVKIPGGVRAGLRRLLAGNPEERQAALQKIEEIRNATTSEQFPQGAEPTLGEARKSPMMKRVENYSEYILGSGRGGQLEKQNKALVAAVEERAGQTQGAGTLVDRSQIGMAGPGSDINASAARELASKRAPAVALMEETRQAVGASKPITSNTIKAYNSAINEASARFGSNSLEVAALKKELDNLIRGDTARTFGDLEAMQNVQQDISARGKYGTEVEQNLARFRGNIGRAMGNDLTATAYQVGMGGKWRHGNKIYSDTFRFDPNSHAEPVGRSQKEAAKILHGQDEFSGKTLSRLFQGDNPDMARYAYSALDEQGRESVRVAIMDRVLEAMKNEKGPMQSPKKAANSILENKNFINQFFGKDGKDQIFGLQKALAEMERSGQYMESISTGKFVPAMEGITRIGTALTALFTGHPIGAALVSAPSPVAFLFSKLTATPGGKAWLLKASTTTAGSKAMQSLVRGLPAVISETSPKNVVPFNPSAATK